MRKNRPVVVQKTNAASTAQIWRALTDLSQMKQWYFDIPLFKPEIGATFEFTAGPSAENQYVHRCTITDLEVGKKLQYTWAYAGYSGISRVTFTLAAKGPETTLTVTHTGLESFPATNPDFDQKNFKMGWTHILSVSLKNFLSA